MPIRPAGTDGSDWSYREVIEDRYKRMAVNMAATFFLHQVQSAILLLKLGWYMVPVVTEEQSPDNFMYPFLLFLVVGNITFYAGRPRGRCVVPLMKVAALLVMATFMLQLVAMWRYHLLNPKTMHISRRLYKALRDKGSINSGAWLTGLETLEGLLDAGVFLSSGYCFYVFNNWVRDAMDAAKERQERNKAAGAGAAPAVTAPPAGVKKRR